MTTTIPGIVYSASQVKAREEAQASYSLQPHDVPIIIGLTRLGFHQKRIAALFDVNQGRIAEVVRDAKKAGRIQPTRTDYVR